MNESAIHTFRGDVTGEEFKEYLALLVQKIPVAKSYSAAWTPALVGANNSAERTLEVFGLSSDDLVLVTPPGAHPSGVIQGQARATDDLLRVTFGNFTGGSLTPVSGTYKIFTWRL